MGRDPVDPIAARARETGQLHAQRCGSGSPRPIPALNELERIESWLRKALDAAAAAEPAASSAAEWLLDNGYRVQRAVLQVKQDLPRGFYRRLRPLGEGSAAGEPLCLLIAHDMLHATHFQLSREAVLVYLRGYQEEYPLTIAELWAIPAMLRIACLERLVGGFDALFPSVPMPFAPSASCRMFLEETAPNERVARGIANLGAISGIAWKDVFDAVSLVERVLADDPAGVYAGMDFETRDEYRRAVERIACRCDKAELAIADRVVGLARAEECSPRNHVGYWLIGQGLAELERENGACTPIRIRVARLLLRHPGKVYTLALFLLGLAGLAVPAAYLAEWAATPLQWVLGITLSILPATVISVTLVNWLITLTVRPTRLAKLDFARGIDPAWPTVVAMPVIVHDAEEVPALLARLEAHFLANPGARGYVLLSDPSDAVQECCPGDEAVERALREGIETLNNRHGKAAQGGPFCLLHRARRFNPAQGCWMAWERKRGKLEEFNSFLLTGESNAFPLQNGPVNSLRGARFVVTADADTRLPPGSVARLAGTLAHPLNRPIFDESGRVAAGYTVLQPRVEIAPRGSDSLFARLFGGDTAIDIYSRAVSDVYQDLVGSGNYVGKGIYDVAAFTRSLEGRVPENNLLSHDLWEGLHGRAGLVTDVIVYESFPKSYGEYVRRWHRWVRGDWQLLPWLFARVPGADNARLRNRLTLFDRLRLWDNMRRSLIPPSVFLLLLAGWLVLPGSPFAWTAFALLAPGAYLFTDLVTGVARGRRRGVLVGSLRRASEHAGRWALSITFLIIDSVIALHAIGTSIVRLMRGRRLLDWTSAAHVSRAMVHLGTRGAHWRGMWVSPAAALLLLAPLSVHPPALVAALPVLLLWFVAPELAWLTGRSRSRRVEALQDDERVFLRLVARRSWLFFEEHVRPEEHWLPPDNHQEEPVEATARRTSPTNIGMMLLSVVAAWRLGHIGVEECLVRSRETLNTLDRLERWNGHILNWYDIVTLAPLEPRYVSTVDSGNLAVSLVTLAKGCEEMIGRPAFNTARWQGLDDCLALLAEALGRSGLQDSSRTVAVVERLRGLIRSSSADPVRWPDLLEACGEECADLGNDLVTLFDAPAELRADALSELRTWLERSEHHLAAMRREADEALPWLWRLADAPAGADELAMELGRLLSPTEPIGASRRLAAHADRVLRRCEVETANPAIRQWLAALDEDIGRGLSHWRQLEEGLGTLAGRASDFAEAMNFEPLYDRNERLFFIGYNVSDDRMDQHHYDLLASEARLASFFAIAKQDVPAEHWFQLGRPIVKRRGELALVSWNGSMFEYLMPRLFLRSDAGTLLSESNGSSVDIQRRYGAARGIPWGISESGFGSVSSDATWRYRAFGVPQLGLRRGLSEDLVVAPYSTALALAVRPKDAVENMRELAAIGALGRCGFYEALDFTKGRRGEGEAYRLVKSHMSHHMGMSIAAIANVLFDDIFVRLFHQDARVQTVDLLLHERVPWELPPEVERIEPFAAQAVQDTVAPRSQPWTPSGQIAPALYALGNGQLTSLIGEDGSGELLWRGQALTRPGDAGEGNGHFVYLRDVESGDAWSATSAPVRGGERRRTRFHAHKVEFRCQSGGISSRLELMVAPAENVQIRRLRLVNKTPATRTIEVASHAEIALAPPADWSRHPAFARMFVAAGTHPEFAALSFERRARDPAETAPVMVERLVADETGVRLTGWEVSRAVTRGRHGTAAAFPVFSGRLGPRPRFPLDPASALLTEVVLPPRGEAELAFVTSAAATLEDALELARRYGSLGSLDWAEQDAAERSARELQDLGLAQDRLADAQLLFSVLHTRSGPQFAGEGTAGREDLWAMGLSGDQPILLVELPDEFDIGELRFLLAAHRQWRWRGCKVDLALLHPGLPGYVEPMRERLLDLLREAGSLDLQGERGGIHILGREQIQPGRVDALREAAAVGLTASGVPVGEQLERRLPEPALSPAFTTSGRDFDAPPDAGLLAPDLRFHNGIGGFGANGNYVLDMGAGKTTPAPWSNVLANEHFGAIVTEAGLGCTFAGNSGENRLTPWHNDPLSDLQGEALYLRDEETAAVWTVAPLPAGRKNACQIEHGPGKTVWRRESEGLSQEMSCCVADSDPVKLVRVRLTDRLGVVRRITATYFADWLLGADAQEPGPFRRSWYRADFHALLAQNRWHREFAGRIAFLAATEPPHSLTTSRREFLGQPPDWRRPQGLVAWDPGNRLQNRGEDSGAALQLYFDIPAGGSCEFAFVLGQTGTESEAAELIARWQDIDKVADEFDRVERHWDERLGSLRVDTPDPALDLMVNRWLPCQAIASRLFARAGFYQAGGAFGFRDQLQDVLALLVVDPRLARDQILRAAAHQFEEGDVLHWWHPPSGRGVRTRCSDDLLWLPFTVARYVEATGDHALLDERAPFLHAAELLEDEHDRYAEFSAQGEASIHEHCLRAFDRAWRLGEHGLPLIGDGDWNDGMNRVGHGGKGESVWLAWFMAATIRNFAAMERALGRDGFGEPWLARAEQLVAAIERHGWDGEWYMRAFDDLGRPWGSRENEECNIDSISQSWAVIAGGGDPKRARTALDSAFARLVRPGEGIVRLLDPPFAETLRDPGYIKAYPPGIRENGGQYSHAAAWLGIALAMQGDGDRAKEVFDRLNPILHSDTREQTERYLVEPYVVAADIGGADPHLGRGGWSWYTGAAAWSWRLAVEHMLGIRLMDGGIEVRPCLPSDWNGFEATVMGEGSIEITVKRGAESRLTVDGVATSFDGDPIAFPGKCKVRRVRLIIAASARKPHAHDANGSRVQGQAVRG